MRDWPAELLALARPTTEAIARRRSTGCAGRSTPAPGPRSATWRARSASDRARAAGRAEPAADAGDRRRLARRPARQARDGPRGARRGQGRARRPARDLLRGAARLRRRGASRSCSRARARSRSRCSASWPWRSPRSARRSRRSTPPCSPRGRRAIGPLVFPPPAFDDASREQARRALTATEVAQPALGAASRRAAPAAPSRWASSPTWSPATATASWSRCTPRGASRPKPWPSSPRRAAGLMRDAAGRRAGRDGGDRGRAGRRSRRSLDGHRTASSSANLERPAADGHRRARAMASTGSSSRRGRRASAARRCRSPAPSTRRWSPRPRASRWRAWPQGSISAPPDRPVYRQPRRRALPGRPRRDRRPAGRAPRRAGPVRRDDRGDARRRGSRVFVEVGPGSVLTPLVGSILGDRPHLAVSCDAPGRAGHPGAPAGPGQALSSPGVPSSSMRLTAGREARLVDLDHLPAGDGSPPLPASTWLVNGSRARPLAGPEPRRLGQAERPAPSPAGTAVTRRVERQARTRASSP